MSYNAYKIQSCVKTKKKARKKSQKTCCLGAYDVINDVAEEVLFQ